ncbi:MAG: succinoglycan biosynthesis transport protein ExoP, partial [Verrucomicrobiales bacterium]
MEERPLPATIEHSTPLAVQQTPIYMAPPPAATPPVELPTLDFLGLFQVIARRKWIILAMLLAWIGLAAFFLKHSPEVFESTGELKVASRDVMFGPSESEDFGSIDALKTVERNLQSTTLVERMIQNQGLADHLKGSLAAQIAQVQGRSSIQLARGTRNVVISYRSTDPAFAKRVVEAYIAEFKKVEQEDKVLFANAETADLAEQEAKFKAQVKEAEDALDQYATKHDELDLRTDGNIIGAALSDLRGRAEDAQSQRIALEKQLGSSGQSSAKLLELPSMQLPEIQALRATLRKKQSAFESLKKEYGPRHPDYVTMVAEVDAANDALQDAVRSSMSTVKVSFQNAVENEKALNERLNSQKGEVAKRERVVAQYKKLQGDVDNLRPILNEVTTALYQAQVNSGLEPQVISIKQEPMVSEYPIWPNKPFILAGGLLAGIVSGLGIAFAMEMLRQQIRDEGDVAKLFPELNCLAQLPVTKMRKPEDKLVLVNDPHSVAAEGFRGLRTSLYFRPQGEPKITVMTSANAGDGKSFCAMNCAASYAMQGFQTLLIDGDLRCPSLEDVFLKGRNRGMTDLLRGRAEPQDVCYPTQVKGLYFIPSGELRANPSELLAGPGLVKLLAQAAQFFDKIVIDSAPIVPVSDGLMLAGHADATCLVVRANTTKKKDLAKARQILNKTGHPLAGYILNGSLDGDAESSYVTYMSKQQRMNLKSKGDA